MHHIKGGHMKPQRGLNKKSGFTTSTFAQRRGGPNAPKQQNGSDDDEEGNEEIMGEFGPFVEGDDFGDFDDDEDGGVMEDPR
jgi:hypothetical protein